MTHDATADHGSDDGLDSGGVEGLDTSSGTARASSESGTVGRMQALIEPICADLVVELVDVEYNHGIVKVVIDEEGGLNSQTLVDMTKEISRMIDREDPIPGRFTLEVTSPGVERPLKKPAHFQRAIASDVAIKTEPTVEGDRRVSGRLASADDQGITIDTDSGERTLRYDEIRTAKTTYPWDPKVRPGKGPKAQSNADKKPQTKEPARP